MNKLGNKPGSKPGRPVARGNSTTTHTTARKTEIEILRSRVEDLIQKKPEKAAKILSLWIAGNFSRKKTPGPGKKAA